jgi:penicillin-binding protein 2
MSLNHGLAVNFSAPAGAVVVMNHTTGQIAAMASYPTYDNRWFGADISGRKFNELFVHLIPGTERADPDQSSLTNRATQGMYNLGSTFKPFVAYAGMMANLITPGSTYDDDGIYESTSMEADLCAAGFKCSWRNSVCGDGRPCRYGRIDASTALAVSSDGFFYWLGEKFFLAPGYDRELLARWVEQFGFGSPTGVDLPSEGDGRVPTNESKAALVEAGALFENEEPRLLLGDVINMSIGQGLMASTPLQLTVAYGAIGNGGYRMVPRVVQAVYAPGTPAGAQPGYVDMSRAVLVQAFTPEGTPIEMRPEVLAEIDEGLRRNVLGIGTSAHSTTAGELFNRDYNSAWWTIPVAGKTGTAQGANSYPWNDSSVFAAYSEDPDRPYTIVAYLEKSGYGSQGGAPVVKCMFMAVADPLQMGLAPVEIAEPLDLTNDVAAENPSRVDTSCMGRTDMDNVTPVPPQDNISID